MSSYWAVEERSFIFDKTHRGLICHGNCQIASNPSKFFEPSSALAADKSNDCLIDQLFAQWACCDFRSPTVTFDVLTVLMASGGKSKIDTFYRHLVDKFDASKLDRNLLILIYLALFKRQTSVLKLVLGTAGKLVPKCTLSHLLLHSIELQYEEGVAILLEHGASAVEGLCLLNSTLPFVVCVNQFVRLAMRRQYPPERVEIESNDSILEMIISRNNFQHNRYNIFEDVLCKHLAHVAMASQRSSTLLIKTAREALPSLSQILLESLLKAFNWQELTPSNQQFLRLGNIIENCILPLLRNGTRLDSASVILGGIISQAVPWSPNHESASLHLWNRPDGFEKLIMESSKKASLGAITRHYESALFRSSAEKQAIMLAWRGKLEQFQRQHCRKLQEQVRKQIVEMVRCEDDVKKLMLPQCLIDFLCYSDLKCN